MDQDIWPICLGNQWHLKRKETENKKLKRHNNQM